MSTTLRERVYPETSFGGFSRVNGTVAFYTRVRSLVDASTILLDLGCGRGKSEDNPSAYQRALQNFKGDVAKVIGIDVDPAGEENPKIDEFRLIEDINNLPVDDASVDVILSDYVLEHVEDPEAYLAEVRRILKPGGYFCARTPNRYGYVSLAASLIPNRAHANVVAQVQDDREEHDVFPTFYRMNRRGVLRDQFRRVGFSAEVIRHEGEPTYFAFSPVAYRAGAFLHRFIPTPFKNHLFVFARKDP